MVHRAGVQSNASDDPVTHLSLDRFGPRRCVGITEHEGVGDVAADGWCWD